MAKEKTVYTISESSFYCCGAGAPFRNEAYLRVGNDVTVFEKKPSNDDIFITSAQTCQYFDRGNCSHPYKKENKCDRNGNGNNIVSQYAITRMRRKYR